MWPAAGNGRRGRDTATFAVRLIALLLQVGGLPAQERQVEVGDITVFADQRHVALGTALAEAAGQPHEWLGFGRLDVGRILLVLANDRGDFQRLSRGRLPGWGAGATISGGRLVIIRLDAG